MLKFELTLEETNLILGALGKQSFEVVAPVIQKIQAQAQPQLPALEAARKEAAEKTEA